MLPEKIVSGGQAGVDRAALDAALEAAIPCGGWCPLDRAAEDGRIAGRYPLRETASADPAVRTELNVLDSDGTLILAAGPLTGGTRFTLDCAAHHDKPRLVVDLESPIPPAEVQAWLERHSIRVLNVAGPRESHRPGFVYRSAREYLGRLFRFLKAEPLPGAPIG